MLDIYNRMRMKWFKKLEFPNTYIIVFFVILLAAVATWIVPGGKYVPEGVDSVRFEEQASCPQTWQVMTALYEGFVSQAGIIVFILIIGGAFWVVNSVKAIDAGILSFLNFTSRMKDNAFLKRLGVDNIVIVSIMLLFSVFGAVFGMSEETIAFAVLVIPLAISMGYDSIVGLCMVYVAAHVGFAGAILNPFTIGVAQTIAGLQMFSGLEYRLICWIVLNIVKIAFVLRYAARVKKNPQKSIMYEADAYWRNRKADAAEELGDLKTRASWLAFGISSIAAVLFSVFFYDRCTVTFGETSFHVPWLLPAATVLYVLTSLQTLRKNVRFFVLNMLGFTIVYLVIGVLGYSWYIPEITGLFLTLGVLSGIAAGYTPNKIVSEFMAGAKDIFSAALIVGLAAGIVIILRNGNVIDPMLHAMASGLEEGSRVASLGLMYVIQTLINVVIPSASAKAAITMPIMAPFADLIDLSRQSAVLAFQFGDGFTNMITPTSGVLIAVLGIARIPYGKWFKFIFRFILLLILIGFLLLLPTVFFDLKGF